MPSGELVPALGQGTWGMAEQPSLRAAEIASLRAGIDLYLLHWSGSVPLEEALEGFDQLQRDGHIRSFGVSNLDTASMDELWHLPGGQGVQTNQVLYNLARRGVEWDLLPWLLAHDDVIVIPKTASLARLAENHGALAHSLDSAAMAELDRLFPPPQGPLPLEML